MFELGYMKGKKPVDELVILFVQLFFSTKKVITVFLPAELFF